MLWMELLMAFSSAIIFLTWIVGGGSTERMICLGWMGLSSLVLSTKSSSARLDAGDERSTRLDEHADEL